MLPLLLIPALAACASNAGDPPQQAQLSRALAPPKRLEPAQDLPEPARAIIRTRMASHASEMSELMDAIMVLDYPRIRSGADAIAHDVRLARPLTHDATELNAAIPTTFFDLQDELHGRAGVLATAAERQSAFEVADAYGRVSETCVRCHASYRKGTSGK